MASGNNINVESKLCWAQWFPEVSISDKLNIESTDNVEVELLVLSTSLNHWLPGSHVLSVLRHLQVLVTMMLLVSTSKQTLELLLTLDERCIFESEIISHLELGPEHVVPSFAGFPSPSACKQKYVPFITSVFWGV